ncbi:MAG: hypothetical protein H0U71_08345 [Gammaproteobacteria bacterium]|nr:hypothetical protein [Gammaproteobacteria bacterium]
MKKTIIFLSLLFMISISSAEYRIMGYYRDTAYGDYVIVYGYYQSDGRLVLSHCRTDVIAKDIYSNQAYLDINNCSIQQRVTPVMTSPNSL